MSQWFLENYGDKDFQGLDLSELEVDEAYVIVSSTVDRNLSLFHKSNQCYGCPYRRVTTLPAGVNTTLKYNVNSQWSFLFNSLPGVEYIRSPGRSPEITCSFDDLSIGEFGVYHLQAHDGICEVDTLKEPVFTYAAVIFAVIFYMLLWLLSSLVKCFYNRCRSKKQDSPQVVLPRYTIDPREKSIRYFTNDQLKESVPAGNQEKKSRLKSLDTFRGITIFLMLLVNHGGGKYWFLEHAPWNGLTPADLVFPWFLWIMGVCIPMGLQSQLKKNLAKKKIFFRIVQRSLKLFAIGLILNSIGGHNQLETYRIPGVLQRFAISYFVTSCIYLLAGPTPGREPIKGVMNIIDDVIVLFPQWVLYILLVIGHTVFIFFMPIEGCPRGYVGPGGMALFQEGKPSPDCVGGITRLVDIWILGNNHIYQHPSSKEIYETSSLDPEGILGCVPTLLQVFLGIQAGQILSSFKDANSRIKRFFFWGFITLMGGLFMCTFSLIEGPIPVNKNLWSLSYVLLTSSFAFFLLAVCFFLVDHKKFWSGSPFFQTGMNSIFLYIGHFFFYNVSPFRFRYGPMKTHLFLFTEALFATTLWTLVALYLHRKKKFYTV